MKVMEGCVRRWSGYEVLDLRGNIANDSHPAIAIYLHLTTQTNTYLSTHPSRIPYSYSYGYTSPLPSYPDAPTSPEELRAIPGLYISLYHPPLIPPTTDKDQNQPFHFDHSAESQPLSTFPLSPNAIEKTPRRRTLPPRITTNNTKRPAY